jgi:hypothetical protein
VIAQAYASRDIKRELIRGYVEGKSAPSRYSGPGWGLCSGIIKL